MGIADKPNLVGLIISLILVVHFIFGALVIKKKIFSVEKSILIMAVSNSMFLSLFLYFVLNPLGFSIIETIIVFGIVFLVQMSLRHAIKQIHENFFKKDS